jgi:hypothetical protein
MICGLSSSFEHESRDSEWRLSERPTSNDAIEAKSEQKETYRHIQTTRYVLHGEAFRSKHRADNPAGEVGCIACHSIPRRVASTRVVST